MPLDFAIWRGQDDSVACWVTVLFLPESLIFSICGPGWWPPSQVAEQIPLEDFVKGWAEPCPLLLFLIFPSKTAPLKNKTEESGASCVPGWPRTSDVARDDLELLLLVYPLHTLTLYCG